MPLIPQLGEVSRNAVRLDEKYRTPDKTLEIIGISLNRSGFGGSWHLLRASVQVRYPPVGFITAEPFDSNVGGFLCLTNFALQCQSRKRQSHERAGTDRGRGDGQQVGLGDHVGGGGDFETVRSAA